MMNREIVASVQEGYKLKVVLLGNHGFSSIGGLSRSIGPWGSGTQYRFRNPATGQLDGPVLPVDFVANATSLGALRSYEEGKPVRGMRSAGTPRYQLREEAGRSGRTPP